MKPLFENWREFINEQSTALDNEEHPTYGDLVPFKAKPNAYKLYKGVDPPGLAFSYMMQGAAPDGKDIYFRSKEEQEEWLAQGQVFAYDRKDDTEFEFKTKKVLYNTKDFIKWYELALQELNMEGGFSDVEVGQLSSLPFKGVISCPNGDCYKKMLALGHVKYDYMNKPISAAKKLRLRGSARRTPAEFIVLHITETYHPRSTQAALADKKASTNYEITQDGIIYEYVASEEYTQHAGWINSYSVGIDFTGNVQGKQHQFAYKMHKNDPPGQFNAEPLSQGNKLVSHLCKKYNIPQVVAPYNFRYLFNKALINISKERKEVGVIKHMWYGSTKKEFMALQELDIRDLLKQFGYGIIPHKVVNPDHGCPGPNFEYSSFGDVSGHNVASVQQRLS